MPDSASHDVESKMQVLRARYVAQLANRVAVLKRFLAERNVGAWPENARMEMKALAHKLSGTGATYGFPEISIAGRALEELLMHPAEEASPKEVSYLRALLAACELAKESSSPAAAVELHEEAEVAGHALPKMLVVDDDDEVHAILHGLFARDAVILKATNSHEALALMRAEKPDLVLLDDWMPEGTHGLKLLEEIRAMPDISGIPVVMITASDRPEEMMQGLMAGAVDYITKPFSPTVVSEKIKRRLQRLGRHILIVDDDESVRELLAHKFRHAGCKVSMTVDGTEAWKFLLKNPVSLALLDRMMPGIEGLALLRMMKETKALAHIPVVFLTARHYSSNVLEGLNTGAEDYIIKPFNPEEVVARCMRLMQESATASV
jgi:two-component system cell cycle response regulator